MYLIISLKGQKRKIMSDSKMSSQDESKLEKAISQDSSSENHSINEYHGFDAHTSENIQNLARTFTHDSFKDDSSAGLLKYLTHMSEVPGSIHMNMKK